MPLILAIEPDQRQAAQLADLIRGRLNADLVHAQTTEGALTALARVGDRVPDLVLVPSLLSAQEDAEIAGALRMIAAAANVRMLTIPKLADPNQPNQPSQNRRGVFAKLRGRKTPITPGGCEPAVFADQIASYLAEAAAERRAREADADLVEPPAATAASPVKPAIDAQSPAGRPLTATPVVGKSPAPVSEPVVEPPVEPVKMRFKPLVIGPTPPPARAVDAYASIVRDEPVVRVDTPLAIFDAPARPTAAEEPRSIWLDGPDEPTIKPEHATTPREPLFDGATIREESPEPVESPIAAPTFTAIDAALPLVAIDETPQPLATEDAQQAIAIDDVSQILAIEEVLQALALEETPQLAAEEPPPIFVRDEAPPVAAIREVSEIATIAETLPAIPIDYAPVAVEIPEAPEIVTFEEPEPVAEPKPVVRRRRRKSRPVSESDDRFDIDALLAPLLSEIAAKRAAPARSAQLRIPKAVEETPAAAFRAPEVISPPLSSAVETASPLETAAPVESVESVEMAELAVSPDGQLPHFEPPHVEPIAVEQQPAALTPVEPLHLEPLEVAPLAIEPPVAATVIERLPVEPPLVVTPVEPIAVEIAQVETSAVPPPPVPVAVASAPAASMPVVPTPVDPQPVAQVPIAQMHVEQLRVEQPPVEEISVAEIPVAEITVIPVAMAAVAEIAVEEIPVAEIPVAEIPVIPVAKIAVAEIAVEEIPVAPMPVAPVPVAPVPVARMPVEQPPVRTIAAATEVDPMFFADDAPEAAADPAPHDRPAWVELIESLRKDIERLKADRPHVAAAAPAAQAAEPVEEPQAPRVGRILSIAAARPANRIEAPAPTAKVRTLTPRAKAPKPVQDQWGLFDPDQCGFAALRAKLDEISAREEVSL